MALAFSRRDLADTPSSPSALCSRHTVTTLGPCLSALALLSPLPGLPSLRAMSNDGMDRSRLWLQIVPKFSSGPPCSHL